jgi:hypothetical protein
MSRYIIFGILVTAIILMIVGCKQDSSTPVEPVNSSLLTYQPKGTISGLVKDRITNIPVARAIISLGYDGVVKSTTSDGAGAFSFAHVPVGQYQIVNGSSVLSGTYTLTVSLIAYNAAQTDQNMKYRDYYYSTVTIKFTSLSPGDSIAVSDMVGTVLLQISHRNTTVAGYVVDSKMQPVSNASVMLFDATVIPNIVIGQTQTSTTGMYQFTRVDNGLTVNISARSADGSLEGSLPSALTLPANVTMDSLRSQVTAEKIMVTPADDINPFVIGITPENNADVSPSNLQLVYTFSEPIKQTAYTRTDLPEGHSTMLDDIVFTYIGLKKTAGTVPITLQWNSIYTQLTVTPNSLQIVGSAKYSLDMRTIFSSGKITDVAGKAIQNNTALTGDYEVLLFSTNGSSSTPNPPSLTRRYVSGIYSSLEYNGGTVGLQWNNDNNARSYNIYKSVGSGSYELLQADFYGLQFSDNSGSLVIPAAVNNPLRSSSVRYLVRAVSKDLVESAPSNIITVGDDRKPRLINASVATAGSTNIWSFTLLFSEPLSIAPAEIIGNYTFTNTQTVSFTVNNANYLGYSGGQYVVQITVTTSAALPLGYILMVGNAIIDLAGNTIDPTANSKTF